MRRTQQYITTITQQARTRAREEKLRSERCAACTSCWSLWAVHSELGSELELLPALVFCVDFRVVPSNLQQDRVFAATRGGRDGQGVTGSQWSHALVDNSDREARRGRGSSGGSRSANISWTHRSSTAAACRLTASFVATTTSGKIDATSIAGRGTSRSTNAGDLPHSAMYLRETKGGMVRT